MEDRLKQQRTFALAGSSGSGKTSLAEMFLYNAKVTTRLGSIDAGNTILDYEPEETKKGGSVQPAYAVYSWNKNRHFLIDNPGDTNFLGEFPYQLAAADGVIYVVDAVDGVKAQDKKLWKDVRQAGLPSMVVINKMDRERADFEQAYAGLSDVLGVKPVLLYLPIGSESNFQGLVDVLNNKALIFDAEGKVKSQDVPEDLASRVAELYEAAVENIAESDEELMEKYLEEGELSAAEIQGGLRKGVIQGDVVPVCVAAAAGNKGGAQILDQIQDLLPSPLERESWQGTDGSERESSLDAPLACFVFKTITTPFGGQLSMLRVLSGKVSSDIHVYNPVKDAKEKLGALQFVVGKKQDPCKEEVGPGAIVAVAKLKSTATGDTICGEKDSFILDKPALPPQLLSFALTGANKEDEDKMVAAIQKLLEEDTSLKLEHNEETRDILLSGMGQLHIETAVEKVRRRNKVEVQLHAPKIPYRETIKASAEVQGRYKKQTGGRGQFGDCWIKLEPQERGQGYEFVNQIVGGVIPKTFIPAVDQGIQEAAQKGVVAGYPVVDFKVTLFDGSYHSVDSSEMAFKIAGSMAFKKAAEKTGVTLLEPVMKMSISVPDEYMGDIIGDLSSRRGKVLGYESNQGITEINAQVPMAEILRYAPDLRAMTGGQGLFTMEFDHYAECPPNIQEKILEEKQAQAENA
ncbi:elongation factor G [Desulfovermiculus halophilus]|jgi:elongation factor G|uniref:elongation factor G n=1 Tax=Desulfovermiculus halophilus TaxID=339722 RepID=UPI0004885F44|nr:elongation factor G [Desulfovermiculus halophilus]